MEAPEQNAQALNPALDSSLNPSLESARAQLAALQRTHEQLLYAVSHDLRAPLRHVSSFVPLLRESVQALQAGDGAAGAEALEFMALIEQAARNLGAMVEALLELSRVRTTPLQCQAVDALALAREQAQRLSMGAPARDMDWQIGGPMDGSRPSLLWADAPLLGQALAALLDNAVKFTQTRPLARIAVQVAAEGDMACVSVQDNGVGFDSARVTTLGTLFQRQHSPRAFEGIGAGLALAQAIAQRHGGHITCSAQIDQGCCARLHWPLAGR